MASNLRHIIIPCLALGMAHAISAQQLSAERDKMEQAYLRAMECYQCPEPTPERELTTTDLLLVTTTDSLYLLPGPTHLIDEINRNTYFQLCPNGAYEMVYDPRWPIETLSNLLIDPQSVPADPKIEIKFNLYGNKKEYLTLPLKQLLGYAASQGEIAYCGAESQQEDSVEMALFLDNPAGGYEHVMYLQCHPQATVSADSVLHGEAYLFSPRESRTLREMV